MTDYQLHSRLGYRISRLSQIMQSRLESQIADLGLSRLMWCALTGIADEAVTTPSALADYIGVTRPAMSRLLRGLEAKGYVMRKQGQGDGRGVILALTPTGRSAHAAARIQVDAQNDYFLAKLSKDQREALMQALSALSMGEAAAPFET
jgi:DNA-binding MarR family transcriptional regulator